MALPSQGKHLFTLYHKTKKRKRRGAPSVKIKLMFDYAASTAMTQNMATDKSVYSDRHEDA